VVRRLILCASLAIAAGCGPRQLAGGDLSLKGVTSDGFAIVADPTGLMHALSLDDGHAQAIARDRTATVEIFGTLVTLWDTDLQLEALWSNSAGLLPLPMDGDQLISRSNFDAASDGSAFAFLLILHGVEAPTLMVQTVGGQPVPVNDGLFVSTFVGKQLLYTVVGQLTTLMAFDPATGQRTKLLDDFECQITAGPTGTSFLACTGGQTVLVTFDGATPRAISSDATFQWIAHDGATVFFQTMFGALMRSTPSGLEELEPAGSVMDVFAVSPDDREVLISDPMLFMSVEALMKGATPIEVSEDFVPASGPPFTSDGRFVLLSRARQDEMSGIFDLVAVSADNGAQTTFTKGVDHYLVADGSRVVAHDHRVDKASTGDLELFDLANGSGSTIASGVNPDFFLAPDGKSVLFTIPGQALFQQSL
jgi:hypothetical protein